jgi:hypothetical protein
MHTIAWVPWISLRCTDTARLRPQPVVGFNVERPVNGWSIHAMPSRPTASGSNAPRALEVAWPPTSGRARVRSTESIFRLTEGRHHMVLGDLLNQLHVPFGQPAVRGLVFRTG